MTITSFVSGSNTYTFPTSPGDQSFRTNFGNVKNFMQALPGVNSGFNMHGDGRRPTETATVQFSIYLKSATVAGMQALRDSINKMLDWGNGRLIDTLPDGSTRWCNCWLNAMPIIEERHRFTNLHQPVQLTFATDDPFWYANGTETSFWGGTTWGGSTWGGSGSGTSVTNSGTLSITYNGSAYTIPRWSIVNTSGSTVSNIRLERVIDGATVDELYYSSTLANNAALDIEPTRGVFVVNGANVYRNIAFRHPDCIRLVPGANSIRVTLSGTVTVTPNYYLRYI